MINWNEIDLITGVFISVCLCMVGMLCYVRHIVEQHQQEDRHEARLLEREQLYYQQEASPAKS